MRAVVKALVHIASSTPPTLSSTLFIAMHMLTKIIGIQRTNLVVNFTQHSGASLDWG